MIDGILSTRTKHIFRRHFNADRSKLIIHFNKNGHFFDIQGCGQKSNEELVELARQLGSRSFQINEIKELPSLSVRAENIFKKYFNGSETELIKFYKNKSHFLDVKNSGKKTSEELIRYVRALLNRKKLFKNESNNYLTSIESLDINERKFLKHYLKFLSNKNELSQEITIEQLLNYSSSNSEVKEYLTNIKLNILHCLESIEEGKLVEQYALEIIFRHLDIPLSPDKYIDNSTINLLELFKDVNEKVLNETELYIFNNYLNYLISDRKHTTLEETGHALDLTRERVRQISQKLQEDFDDTFSSFYLLKPFFEVGKYNSTEDSHLITLDKRVLESMNGMQGTNYNHLLISKLLAVIFRDDYSLLSSEKNYHSIQRHSNYLNFNWSYLLSNEMKDKLTIKDFFLRIEDLVEGNYDEDQKFSLKYLLFDFSNADSILKMKKYYESINTILRREFNLIISKDNKFTIRRNTKRKNYEYALEALKELGPSSEGYSIEFIAENILEKYNINFLDRIESLRSAIISNEEFIYFGRSSQYGLRDWEEKFDNIRGGTIRSISLEYLSNCKTPKHKSELAYEVNKYRNTTSDNVLGNLKLNNKGVFKFFEGGFVGLSDKNYDSFEIKKVNPWLFSKNSLSRYLPLKYEQLISLFHVKYGIRKVRLKYIIDVKIEKKELLIDGESRVLELPKDQEEKYSQGVVKKNLSTDNNTLKIDRELIKKMVSWDTKNRTLTNKQLQYLAYFVYDNKKLTDYHKENVKKYYDKLVASGFKN